MPYAYASHNPRARFDPLASIPFARPRSAVLPWTQAEITAFELSRTTNNLAAAETKYAAACAALGLANRARYGRRLAKVAAFRAINVARRQLREAQADRATAVGAAIAAELPLAS
jgi:hypothetical protein